MNDRNKFQKKRFIFIILAIWMLWGVWIIYINNNFIEKKDLNEFGGEVVNIDCVKGRTYTNIKVNARDKNSSLISKVVFNVSHFTNCQEFLERNSSSLFVKYKTYKNASISLALDDRTIISDSYGIDSYNDKTSVKIFTFLLVSIFTILYMLKVRKQN